MKWPECSTGPRDYLYLTGFSVGFLDFWIFNVLKYLYYEGAGVLALGVGVLALVYSLSALFLVKAFSYAILLIPYVSLF